MLDPYRYRKCAENDEIIICGMETTELPEIKSDIVYKLYWTDNNKLAKLPNLILPELKELYCPYNILSELPEDLPEKLTILCCECNKITHLPVKLPKYLTTLKCNYNQITEINNLEYLEQIYAIDISFNKILELPEFNKWQFNGGQSNELKIQMGISYGRMGFFDCSNNPIKFLSENNYEIFKNFFIRVGFVHHVNDNQIDNEFYSAYGIDFNDTVFYDNYIETIANGEIFESPGRRSRYCYEQYKKFFNVEKK